MMTSKSNQTHAMEQIKHGLDAAALTAGLLSFIGVLQPVLAVIATTLSIAWCCVQFYDRRQRRITESQTVKE